MADITLPQLGETVTEGTITRWMKQVGDKIEEDEPIYEVSTDKVDSEVPSPTAGYLAEILVQEGETVEVGVKVAVITAEPPSSNGSSGGGAESATADAPTQAPAASEPAAAPEAPPSAEAGSEDTDETGDDAAMEQAEQVQAGAPETEVANDDPPAGGGSASSVAPAPTNRPADGRPPARPEGSGPSKVLSPVVRRLLAEHGIDPTDIRGSGAGGRITRADVLDHIDTQGRGASASSAPAPANPSAQATPSPASGSAQTAAPSAQPQPAKAVEPATAVQPGENDEVVPFSNIRRRTAEHMVRSLATSAHTLVVIEVDYDNVDRVRNKSKDRFKADEGFGLTYLPFIARAAIDAIAEFPHVNASVGDNQLIVHRYVNLGIAVDLNYEGLIVPVVHDAGAKRLRALARDMNDLAGRARSRKLGADDISGGTFTITNAGGYGTLITGPIINQPQVAILSTDGVKPRPVAVAVDGGGYAIAVHPVGNLAISFDHRAYDGAYASAFLARIKDTLETRDWAAELA